MEGGGGGALKGALTEGRQGGAMRDAPIRPHDPDLWINQMFASQSARSGGVVRRKIDWVDREIGRERLLTEVRSRGFHMLEAGGQFIVVCAPGPIRMVC